ncbi:hypothetical protein MAP00_008505 [Monascus purpureus]|nr:hypothetical protein MAP00_008505 [Monascus purpureus]
MRSSEHTISPLPIFLLQGQQSSQPADHANPLQEIPDSDDEDDTAQAIQKSSTHRVPHHQGSVVAWSHAGRTATDVSMAQEPKPSSQRQLSSTPSWEPHHQQTLQACTTSHPRSSSTEEIPLPPVQPIQRSAWR